MEVLQIQRGRASCCLVLVFGLSSILVLPGIWALLDYIWTTTWQVRVPPPGPSASTAGAPRLTDAVPRVQRQNRLRDRLAISRAPSRHLGLSFCEAQHRRRPKAPRIQSADAPLTSHRCW